MPFFTPVKTLPEGTVYFTDLTPVRDFADWLAEFDTLLDKHQDSLFATVCAPMRLQKTAKPIWRGLKPASRSWGRAASPCC